MSTLPTKKITVPVTYDVPVGAWLVSFTPVWDHDEEIGREWVCDVDAEVRQLTDTDTGYAGMKRAELDPCHTEHDDTHDLTERLYATEAEARAHAEWTIARFKNPQPWESFVKL